MDALCERCSAPISVVTGEPLLCDGCSFQLGQAERESVRRAPAPPSRLAIRAAYLSIAGPVLALFLPLFVVGANGWRPVEGIAHILLGLVLFVAIGGGPVAGAIAIASGRGRVRYLGALGVLLALLEVVPALIYWLLIGGGWMPRG